MNYNPLVASLTIALGALAALGALIWQVTHGHDADAQLAGIVGLLFGAFLRMPGTADVVQIKQPADKPVPVDVAGDVGATSTEILLGICAICLVVLALVALFGRP